VSLRYVDTSALVRCYFPDEADHDELRASLLEGADPVVTSELTRVELASAISAAHRAGRVAEPAELLATIDADCGEHGPIALLRLEPDKVLGVAATLVSEYPLRTLDALHLAVASTTAAELAGSEPVVLVSRDQRQRAAATAIGMPVGPP
jgi:uncharacterized protein